MSDYLMSHDVKQRISDLHHLREQTRQAEALTGGSENSTPTQTQRENIVLKALQLLRNALPHPQPAQTAKPAPTKL